jgi:hypothetical protein
MAGDEIVAEFAGEVYGKHITTTEAVQRFSETSVRLKCLVIEMGLGTSTFYVGPYNSNRTVFLTTTFKLVASKMLTLHYVDLYNLGNAWVTATGFIDIIGTY